MKCRKPDYDGKLGSRWYMLAPRHVHYDKSPFIGSERDPFPLGVLPPRKASVLRVANLKFPGVVSIQ